MGGGPESPYFPYQFRMDLFMLQLIPYQIPPKSYGDKIILSRRNVDLGFMSVYAKLLNIQRFIIPLKRSKCPLHMCQILFHLPSTSRG